MGCAPLQLRYAACRNPELTLIGGTLIATTPAVLQDHGWRLPRLTTCSALAAVTFAAILFHDV